MMYINLNPAMLGANVSLKETLALAQKYDFGGIDVSMAEVADLLEADGATAVQALFADAGVRIGAWGLPVDFRNDEEKWQSGLAELPRLADAAKQLGARRCSTWIMPGSNERTFDENLTFHAERLVPVSRILDEHDILLGLEWVGPKTLRDKFQHPFIHTMGGMLELCDTIQDQAHSDNMGLLVDAFHVYTSHASAEEVRALPVARVVNVHVNDAIADVPVDEQLDGVRDLPCAQGVLDLKAFLHALRDIGYDGPVTAEPFSKRLRELPADEAVADTGTAMHKMWSLL